jgi:DNA-directed RNA polymerase specialized sigma subunit
MPKNLKKYYQAWKLRKQGKKLREIAEIMGLSKERVRFMAKYFNFRLNHKLWKLPKEIKKLLELNNEI